MTDHTIATVGKARHTPNGMAVNSMAMTTMIRTVVRTISVAMPPTRRIQIGR